MTRASEFLSTFILNASWQILLLTVIAYACAQLIRNARASYRHTIWLTALLLSVALPLWSAVDKVQTNRPGNVAGNVGARSTDQSPLVGEAAETDQESLSAAPARSITNSSQTISPTISPTATTASFFPNRSLQISPPRALATGLTILVGLCICYWIIRLALSWRKARSLRRSVYEPELSPALERLVEDCANALKVAPPCIACSTTVQVPVTVGQLKPLIILPDGFYKQQSLDSLRSVLGHEMAHISRRDYAINFACQILLVPISFHPVAHFIKRQIDRSRELACDELVTDTLLEPQSHARFLVEAADQLALPADEAFLMGVFDADILEERIMKLTQTSRRLGLTASRLITVSLIAILCCSAFTISTFSVALQTKPGEAPKEKPVETARAESAEEIQTAVQEQSRLASNLVQTERDLRASSPQQRAQAACDAGRRRSLTSIPELISMLNDDSKIEQISCWSTGNWSPALHTLKAPSPGEQAAIALASMGRDAFGPLKEALDSSNPSVRRNAAWAIGELTNMAPGERAEAVLPIVSLMNDADGWTRLAAARTLGELRDERGSDRLIAGLLDSEAAVRETSAWALGEMKYKDAVESLCNLLVTDIQVEVRLAAAEALGEIGSNKAVASLNRALSDSEPIVRAKAKWALSEIEDTDG
jgi:beta-lactamase regulating signal transducer with metallopeptidase domain